MKDTLIRYRKDKARETLDDARMLAFVIVIHFTHRGQVVENLDDEEEPDDNT